MKRRNFYLFLFFIIPLIYFLSLPNSVGDLAIWIAQGKYFTDTGHLLRHDIYSVLPTRELIYPAGTCIFYALVYSIFGLIGVSLIHKGVAFALSWIWWRSTLVKFESPWSIQTIAVILLCWIGASPLCIDRPALLATLPFLFSFLILQKKENLSWNDIFILSFINLVWVNLHGSWLLLGIMYAWREVSRSLCLRDFRRWPRVSFRQVFGFFALGLSSLINPFGYLVFKYVFETAKISKERGIDEWAVTNLSGNYISQEVIFYLIFLCSMGWLFQWIRTDKKKAMLFLTSPFLVLLLIGFQSVRNTVWIFISFIPMAAQFDFIKAESTIRKKIDNPKNLKNIAIAGLLILLLIGLLPPFKPRISFLLPREKKSIFDSSAPFEFANILSESNDRTPIFNDWEYGSFLALAQPHPIFIDIRNIIYDQKEFLTYLWIVGGNDQWSQLLDSYGIGYVILNKRLRLELIGLIRRSGHWKMLLEDENTVLFKRDLHLKF